MRTILLLLLISIPFHSIPQDLRVVDSLLEITKNPRSVCKGKCNPDTIILNAYNKLGDNWAKVSPDSSIVYFQKAIHWADKLIANPNTPTDIKIFVHLRKSAATGGMAWGNYFLGNYSKAIDLCNEGLKIVSNYEKMPEWKKKIARIKSYLYNNLSSSYNEKGDYENAIKYYFENIKMAELSGDKNLLSAAYGNLGLYYSRLGELDKALEFTLKSADLNKKAGNLKGEASTFGNLSMIYSSMGDIKLAKEYSLKSISMHEQSGDKHGQAIEWANLAWLYLAENNSDKAIECYEKSLLFHTEMENKTGMASTMGSMGSMYIGLKKYDLAEKYLNEYLILSKEIQSKYELEYAYHCLADLYEFTDRPAKALEAYKMHIIYRDSLENEQNTKAQIQSEVQFSYDKKAAKDSVAHADEKKIKNAEIEKQDAELKANRLQKYFLFGGLTLVILFSFFMINRFLVIRKQKNLLTESKRIIEEQKQMVEEKHKEITDSINYAERIQRSFLASDEMLNRNLKEYFVLFQPKDVVSGDFYWSWELNDGKFLLACADSTGHGVPGAIMSLLNISSLEKSIEKYHQPNEILNETRKIIIERLKKDGSAEGGKDGMDCSLISLDFKNGKMSFSLANNPLWLIRENEVIEFSPDKMPVGKHDKQHISFSNQETDLIKGDMIYIFTDGYADQFGGEKGKKFKYSSLKKLLIEIRDNKVEDQKVKLHATFEKWKGNLEQVDDVCLIGIRI